MSAPRSGRRTLRVSAIAAGLLVAGLLFAEVGGRLYVERAAASELDAQGVAGATVTVGRSWWRPMVLPALLGADVDRVRAELRDTDVSGVRVASADYVLDDLTVDPNPFRGTLGVTAMETGTFRLVVTPESVGRMLGVPARVVGGRLVIGPDGEPAKLRTDRSDLVIESAYLRREGIDPRLYLLDTRMLPCEPDVMIAGSAVELRCSGDRLPGILEQPLGEPLPELPAPPELQPPVTAERGSPGG